MSEAEKKELIDGLVGSLNSIIDAHDCDECADFTPMEMAMVDRARVWQDDDAVLAGQLYAEVFAEKLRREMR